MTKSFAALFEKARKTPAYWQELYEMERECHAPVVARLDELEEQNAKLQKALEDMVSLWERVHESEGPVALGRPTLQAARRALKEVRG